MRSIILITPPAVEPVALADAKDQLRVTFTDDDALITGLIVAARAACEDFTGRVFVSQQWLQSMDTFPFNPMYPSPTQISYGSVDPTIYLLRAPVLSVDQVQYMDTTQAQQVLPPNWYLTDGNSLPPRIYPQYGFYWPPTLPVTQAVQIKFTAGYAPAEGDVPTDATLLTAYYAANIPMPILLAIKQAVNYWYQTPEVVSPTGDALPFVSRALLGPYKVW